MNILQEFEKRYKGDPSQTETICTEIANEFGLDPETTADYVYLHRYEEVDSKADELEECDINDADSDF